MKQSKFKTFKRIVGLVTLAAVVALLAAMPLLAREKAGGEEYPLSILSAQAQERTLEEKIAGGGALTAGEAWEVTIPEGVKIRQFLARNGDTLKAGDPIAQLDRVSIMEAVADTQDTLEELRGELETARIQKTDSELTGPKGEVKLLYAKEGDQAAQVMLQYGALAVVSLDGKMVLELETAGTFFAGDALLVTVGEKTLTGTVESCREGTLRLTLPDDDLEVGAEAVVTDPEGAYLGAGSLAIHSPWNAVAYSGTVKTVRIREGQTLYSGAALFTLEETGYSRQCQLLAEKIREQEARLLALFTLYNDLTVKAPADGVVTGIDELSAPMLSAAGGWELRLLANAPNGNDDVSYINFVGQVTQVGTDGLILRLNPQMFSVEDYFDLSGVPTATAAMTETVRYSGAAPVYQRSGEGWAQVSAGAGDILLFAGDALGNIVWAIRMGSAPLPGEPVDPTQPTEPSEPAQPTQPSEPTDPTDPTDPTEPGEETDPTQPGGDTFPNMPNITLPSFGGNYTGGYQTPDQDQQEDTAPQTVTIASLSSRSIMEIPITIDELDIHRLALGQEVTVRLEALKGREFTGTVTAVDHQGVNLGGSTKFTVTVSVAWQEDMLPGMNASVTIPLGTFQGLAVPTAALFTSGGRTLVYTALDPETGTPTGAVEVKTHFSDGDYTLVEGLTPGARVYYGYYEALNK